MNGHKLRLECKAEGVPRPQYLWFQGQKALENQKSSILEIDKVNGSCNTYNYHLTTTVFNMHGYMYSITISIMDSWGPLHISIGFENPILGP